MVLNKKCKEKCNSPKKKGRSALELRSIRNRHLNRKLGRITTPPLHTCCYKKDNLNKFQIATEVYSSEKMYPIQSLVNSAISRTENRLITLDDVLQCKSKSEEDRVISDLLKDRFHGVKSDIFMHLKSIGCSTTPEMLLLGPLHVMTPDHQWSCIYTLSWPACIDFVDVSPSKRQSSQKASLACLLWLQKEYPKCNVLPEVDRLESKRSQLYHSSSSECSSVSSISQNCPYKVNTNFLQNLVTSNLNHALRNYATRANTIKSSDSSKKVSKDECDSLKAENDVNSANSNISQSQDISSEENKVNNLEILKQVYQMYPHPKNVLHNMYNILAKELNNREMKLTPHYKPISKKNVLTWTCTYNLKWPVVKSITESSFTKQEASKKAALVALQWLRSMGRINDLGQPIIYDKTEAKELKKSHLSILQLDKEIVDTMNRITAEYNEKMLPYLMKTEARTDDVINEKKEDEETLNLKNKRQKFLGLQTYTAKEPTVLPISSHKNAFIELLKNNRILILKGEPGCGKSTRVPQYVLEYWAKEAGLLGEPCRIAVTQPRRIAAISLAERVAYERHESAGNVVGYHVRLRSNFSPYTGRIVYCTTGILLRQLQADPSLKDFTYIILDEAHERDVNTDLLMNLLKKSMSLNPQLKLIVMSATIDTDIFKNYFDGAPVMHIPGFTFPVKSYFLDQCKSLDLSKTEKMCSGESPSVVHSDVVNVIDYIHNKKGEGAILCFLPGWEDISRVRNMLQDSPDMSVLCLHSRLQDSDQYKIFSRPPPGVRKVILATNIAETSVTIDDVVYVVDTGIQKEQRFDVNKGVVCIDNYWISQASMTQRKGRAGRVQAGECFHLYPKSKAESFEKFTQPEILKMSLTKIVLDSKVFSNNMKAVEFMNQLLTPPEEAAIMRAVDELKDLELLDSEENLTYLGRTLADFQLEPKLAKAMVNSVIFKCSTPVVDIATLFSAETELFTQGLLDKQSVKAVKKQFSSTSDHLALMRLFEKWLEMNEAADSYKRERFCRDTGLVPHKMSTIEKLRKIHFDYLYNGLYDVLPICDDYSDNDELVKAVILSGVGNFLQNRKWDIVKGRYKPTSAFITKEDHRATVTQDSVNSKRGKYPSDYLIYINETRSNIRRMTLIRECSLISPVTLFLFSNKNIRVTEVKDEEHPDLVQVSLIGTNVNALCDKEYAKTLVKCKEALFAGYKFYILLLTQGGDYHPKINECWDNILSLLNDVLLRIKV